MLNNTSPKAPKGGDIHKAHRLKPALLTAYLPPNSQSMQKPIEGLSVWRLSQPKTGTEKTIIAYETIEQVTAEQAISQKNQQPLRPLR